MTPDECLDEKEALAFVENALPAERRATAERHIESCDTCRRLLEIVASLESAESAAPDNVARELPAAADRYTLLAEHARGGQARVMLAFDDNIGREVALKELPPRSAEDPSSDSSWRDATARFLREAELTGQLAHPGVVPVFEIGRRPDGALFYTMQLVRGRTLSEVLGERRRLPDRLALLGHFVSICHVVAYAHSRGVVHRDIKPQNIMVGEFGETMLLDWGLAKQQGERDAAPLGVMRSSVEASPAATLEGTVVGTPGYMSPEQASGSLGEVDERSDIYGLGAVLFEILTGRVPAVGSRGAPEAVPSVRELCPEAPAELCGVAEKALALEKADRYQHAAELAQDVTAFMTGGRVAAYAYTSRDLLRRFAARHRLLLGAITAIFAVILSALVLLSVAWRSELVSRLAAEESEKAATARSHDALQEGAKLALMQGDALQARAKLRGAFEIGDSLTARALWRKLRVYPERWMANFDTPVLGVSFSPDGRELAVGLQSGNVELVDVATREARTLRGEDQIGAVAYSPGGDLLAAATYFGRIALWDLKGGPSPAYLGNRRPPFRSLAFSPDGARIAGIDSGGRVVFWNARTAAVDSELQMPFSKVLAVAFAPSGRQLAASGQGGKVVLWDLQNGAPALTLFGPVDRIAFGSKGALLAGGGIDGKVYLWDSETGRLLHALVGHDALVTQVAASSDGRLLASASGDGTVRLWNLPQGESIRVLKAGKGIVYDVAFSADSTLLAAASDTAAFLWDVGALQAPVGLPSPPGPMEIVRFSPDGARLATSGLDGMTRLWNASSGELLVSWADHEARVTGICFGPAGKFIASAGFDGVLVIRDAPTGSVRYRLSYGDRSWAIACAPDDARVASGGVDGTIRIWDASTGELVHRYPAPIRLSTITSLAFSADGGLLAAGRHQGRLEIWDASSGRLRRMLLGHTAAVVGLAFHPAQGLLASGSVDGSLRLWSVADGSARLLLETKGRVNRLDWDPRSERLVAASSTGGIEVLSLTSEKRLSIPAHRIEASSVHFAPDGRTAASTGEDGVLRLWDTETWRPKWYARAMLRMPGAQILTHLGWWAPDSSRQLISLAPAASRWRRAVEESREASSMPSGPICVANEASLEIWDVETDARLLAASIPPPFSVAATPDGCSVLQNGEVTLYRPGKPPTTLGSSAVFQSGGEEIVVVGPQVMRFDRQGLFLGSFGAGAGVSAAAVFGERAAVGLVDGAIELRERAERRPVTFRDTPRSAVTQLAAGPSDTLVAGFADGSFGVWSSSSGIRLERGAVVGAVRFLAVDDELVLVSSEVGSTAALDLSLLTADYCELLKEVWSQVPVLWRDQAVLQATPEPNHPCLGRR
jgi:WD40 repeat protein/tRNA A-37 threonylcarbamoyl transferase component Bud32